LHISRRWSAAAGVVLWRGSQRGRRGRGLPPAHLFSSRHPLDPALPGPPGFSSAAIRSRPLDVQHDTPPLLRPLGADHAVGIDRVAYRVTCRACGHVGEVVLTSNDWGRISARWKGFTEGRIAPARLQDSTARCERCGGRTAVALEPLRPGDSVLVRAKR